jgi:hypothetical protein
MRLQAVISNLEKSWTALARIVNGRLSFGNNTLAKDPSQNLDGAWITFTPVAGTGDIILTHNLGRIPVGYIVMQEVNTFAVVRNGTTPWTKTTLSVETSGGAGGSVTVFVV